MKRILALVLAGMITASCGLKARDVIKIIAEVQTPPTNTTPSAPAEPPAPTGGCVGKGQEVTCIPAPEPPKPEPTPEPAPVPEVPFRNLNVRVFDVDTKAPIAGALVIRTIDGQRGTEQRTTDGGGFANFGVQGTSGLQVTAADYAGEVRSNVQPNDNEVFELKSTKPKPVAPPACGTQLNTGFVSFECLNAVAKTSEHWPLCAKGSADDCSLYTWEVARALNAAQNETRWGLITKPTGSNFRGFGEDVVAFLPLRFSIDEKTWQWNGVDIIGGLGGPTPTRNPGKLHPAIPCTTPPSAEQEAERWCNRADNFWVPVPPK